MEPGIYMDWIIDKSFLMPYPSGSGAAYLERLVHIKKSHGLDCVVPNLDSELPFYTKYASELEREGIRTFLPSLNQFRLRGKDKLNELSKQLDMKLPKTAVVTSESTLAEAVQSIGMPVMIKGCFYKAHRAQTLQEATAHYHALVAEWGYPIIVQEVVTGDELNVVGLGDGRGNTLGMVGVKKIWITGQGKMWTGVTVKHEKMLAAACSFVKKSCWRGPFELECIVSGDDVYLIEINPRFPAWTYLATGVGQNLPAQLLRCSFGLPVAPMGDYPAGKLFVRYSYDMVTDMQPFQNSVTRGEHP
jgi:carbamoyl-phosphate synthase large subunit